MTNHQSTTSIGITEEGETYEPLHVHAYFIENDYSGATQTAMSSSGGDNQYHTHAFEIDDEQTMVTEEHFHKLDPMDKARGI